MSDLANVILLAILQGITEFLPVSSSGHLVIGQHLLGLQSPGIRLQVILHLGTMLSILYFYRKRLAILVMGVIRWEKIAVATALHVLISTLPAIIFYFTFRKKIEACFDNPKAVGGALLITGIILTLQRWVPVGGSNITPWRALVTGVAQALAILPGISRSGMTIATARLLGIAPIAAAEFSFVMVLPLLAGAALLDALRTPAVNEPLLAWWVLLTGAAVAAIIGYLALRLLIRTLQSDKFWIFGCYCTVAGAATLLLL